MRHWRSTSEACRCEWNEERFCRLPWVFGIPSESNSDIDFMNMRIKQACETLDIVVEPLLQVHSGARVDRMTLLGSDISLYAGAQPITEQQLGAMHHT